MVFLGPIFAVDLVASARRRRYYVIRVVYATVLLLTLWMNFSVASIAQPRMKIQQAALMAQTFFYSLTTMQLLAVVALGPALAAGTVALERERRTIEYLFASDLTNAEIVLGKLASRLLHLGCLIAVGMPVFALAMLFGGIAPEQLLMTFLITLSTMVMVVALAVNISVWTPRARDAVVRSYVMLVALLVLPPLVHAVLTVWRPTYPALQWIEPAVQMLERVNPFYVLPAMGMAGSSPWQTLGMTAGAQLLFAAMCCGAALFALRRVHLKAAGNSPKSRRRWRRWWRPELGERPMIWKECFAEQAGMRLGIAARLGLLALAVAVFSLAGVNYAYNTVTKSSYFDSQAILITAVVCVGLLLIVARAATSITTEKERQCWESLLLTSLTSREIIWSKIAGSIYAVRLLVLVVAPLLAAGLLVKPSFAIVFPFEIVVIGVAVLSAAALGVFCSTHMKDSLRSMGAALFTAVFIGGGLYFYCCLSCLISLVAGKAAELLAGVAVPFLIFYPMCYYGHFGERSGQPDLLVVACVAGVFGYALVSLVLVAGSVVEFDRRSRAVSRLGKRDRPVVATKNATAD